MSSCSSPKCGCSISGCAGGCGCAWTESCSTCYCYCHNTLTEIQLSENSVLPSAKFVEETRIGVCFQDLPLVSVVRGLQIATDLELKLSVGSLEEPISLELEDVTFGDLLKRLNVTAEKRLDVKQQ